LSARRVAVTVLSGLTLGATSLGAIQAGAAPSRARGDIKVFAHIAKPGEPSLTLVTPKHKVYVGTFEDVTGSDTSASKVFKYNAHGSLRRTYTIKGQTAGKAHGVQVAERDRRGRLYILDQEPARVVVLNPRTGKQQTYATFADVPPCSGGSTKNCSNTVNDGAPEPDYAAWLPDGSLLVTDYSQQLIWRVPPGGGKARIWMNNKVFDGELFGPAGIVLMPSRRSVLLTVATGGLTSVSPGDDPAQGRLYRIHLKGRHRPGRLHLMWNSGVAQAPDGFAVSRNRRHVYIAMAGPTANCVVEVARSATGWHAVQTIPKSPNGTTDSPVPWDTATSVQFLGRRILVTNQSYFTNVAAHWVVFDVQAGERGMRLIVAKGVGARRRT
jgi:sugar lactone lactonase YvrE